MDMSYSTEVRLKLFGDSALVLGVFSLISIVLLIAFPSPILLLSFFILLLLAIIAAGITIIYSLRKKSSSGRTTAIVGAVMAVGAVLFFAYLYSKVHSTLMKEYELLQSIMEGDTEKAKSLIENGVALDRTGQDGNTALHLACRMGRESIVSCLYKHGAEIDARNHQQWTPLVVSIFYGQPEIAEYLIHMGANVHLEDSAGNSPLHHSVLTYKTGVLQLLVRRGAKIDSKNGDGKTPVDLCRDMHYTELLDFLKYKK